MGFSRQEYWSDLPFPYPVDHILSDLSTMPDHLGWPPRAWLSFIELDKAVVLVWLDWLVLWLWFQCVCPLMPSYNTYCLTGFLLPWTQSISSWLLQQSLAAVPYLEWRVFPHHHPPDFKKYPGWKNNLGNPWHIDAIQSYVIGWCYLGKIIEKISYNPMITSNSQINIASII